MCHIYWSQDEQLPDLHIERNVVLITKIIDRQLTNISSIDNISGFIKNRENVPTVVRFYFSSSKDLTTSSWMLSREYLCICCRTFVVNRV